MLPKQLKIEKRYRIEYVIKKGRRIHSRLLQMRFLPNRETATRFSVVVSKKISAKAVIRNKLRRRLHEAIRKNVPSLLPPSNKTCYDVVVLFTNAAKAGPKPPLYKDIEHDFILCMKKL